MPPATTFVVANLLSPLARALRLSVALPDGCRVRRVFGGHGGDAGIEDLALEDMTHHATQVVLRDVAGYVGEADATAWSARVTLHYRNLAIAEVAEGMRQMAEAWHAGRPDGRGPC